MRRKCEVMRSSAPQSEWPAVLSKGLSKEPFRPSGQISLRMLSIKTVLLLPWVFVCTFWSTQAQCSSEGVPTLMTTPSCVRPSPPPVPVPLSPSPRLPQQTMCCDRKKHNKLILAMIAQFHHIAQKVTGKNTTKCLQWQRPYNRLMEDPFQSFYLLTCYCETCGICAYVKPFCTHWGANTSGPRDRLCKPTQADMWRL